MMNEIEIIAKEPVSVKESIGETAISIGAGLLVFGILFKMFNSSKEESVN